MQDTGEYTLPKDAKWADAWTNNTYGGGQWIERETPLEIIPVFLKMVQKYR